MREWVSVRGCGVVGVGAVVVDGDQKQMLGGVTTTHVRVGG
jgi:hypothetical protein